MATAMHPPSRQGTPGFFDFDGQPDDLRFESFSDLLDVPSFLSGDCFYPDMTANEELNGDAASSSSLHLHQLEILPLGDTVMSDESPVVDDPSRAPPNCSAFSDASSSPGGQPAGTQLASDQSTVLQTHFVEDVSVRDSTHSPGGDLILTPSSTNSHLGFAHDLGAGESNDDNISPISTLPMDSHYLYPQYDYGPFDMQQAAQLAGLPPPPITPNLAGRFRADPTQPSYPIDYGQVDMTGANPSAINYNPANNEPTLATLSNSDGAWLGQRWTTAGAYPTASQPGTLQPLSLENTTFDANLAHRSAQHEVAVSQSFPAFPVQQDVNRFGNHRVLSQRHGPTSTSFDPSLAMIPSYPRNVPLTPMQMPVAGDGNLHISNQNLSDGQAQSSSANIERIRSVPVVPSQRARLQHQARHRGAQYNVFAVQNPRPRPAPYPSGARPLQSLAQAPAQSISAESPQTTQTGTSKGGRKKGVPLNPQSRLNSSKCRQDGACWRCAFQRDSCLGGSPCDRCHGRITKGQFMFLPCDRSKIYDFVHDFLPPSMTVMHQKQSILDTVYDQVVEWNSRNPIQVHLTSGYGRPFVWTLYEFRPRTDDLLGQFQYIQNNQTGRSERVHKYSPPFGVMKLDATDEQRVEEYLKDLMHQRYLKELGWKFYEEEQIADPKEFQAALLTVMCNLYMQTVPNPNDKRDPKHAFLAQLNKILRMVIITYIMGHTLTIPDEYLLDVISHVQYTPPASTVENHTSPRLANRQLKFYFAVLRAQMYDDILKQLQQVLRNSKQTGEDWLFSFCAILGLGMVLEEVQRTIWIQADAKIVKKEMLYPEAITEATNACNRIDDRFELLGKLFHAKYKNGKAWGKEGSFGPKTPAFEDEAQVEFCRDVMCILLDGREHLERRKEVKCSEQTTEMYTSRLVSRFLLPFLEKGEGGRRR